ncbi:hypothetical protein COCSADRAFT_85344 [Bipolaris sorokiniana ND90Pr]|uniref:BRCT domain-containing protein n=1 Tax=Cochliobolus sativus (strain ND90Pr / ATCC 201652) TaxID=665912 RepID=M2SHK5_COCSN|nr:uncharacterized protein COCSADRAFT_85344 [Bipolaris sorokiniana ND90Pr]EMD66698.1 hypothetical protein COCSADRAFT_85344 [Bipolaris sorokiniana ND90Pr]
MTVDDPSDTPAPFSYDAGDAGSRSRLAVPSRQVAYASQPSAPARRAFFDPWNSSSTGHQRAENWLSGSTLWRTSRNLKLGEQFKGGRHGGKRIADTVGAGSDDSANVGLHGLRTGGQKSLAEVWAAGKSCTQPSKNKEPKTESEFEPETYSESNICEDSSVPPEKQLFAGLCFYLNGSTAPLVSDHKLKQILATHGATHSTTLGRRIVTHVILGTINARGGAGGGLAATKLQKEIVKTGGKTVKFINADWVLDSIKANRRLPESRYSPLKFAPKSQSTIFSTMRARTPPKSK